MGATRTPQQALIPVYCVHCGKEIFTNTYGQWCHLFRKQTCDGKGRWNTPRATPPREYL